jgi:phosphohistidine phosphatase SixA
MARRKPLPVPDDAPLFEEEKFVILLRHGIAQEKDNKPDAERSLTATGHQRMKKSGRTLAQMFPAVETINSSPLRRCVETAEWVSRGYDRAVGVTESAALSPGASAAEGAALILSTTARRQICVGHEPGLSTLMLHMTAMKSAEPRELKKGGCYGIRVKRDGTSALEWMLPPRFLRRER